ncbi:HAD family hydrolase [Cellulomonas phragmiteti]|uniref:Hydrolase n=1 Tax=Cellulomonas phragmiteti TaxID=478780 RepID=A0ABQ4DHB3_9CELL|nr:HAD family hydrolase [Cellulomonas phragmiteti]GIG38749.1 hydrolase [Cellulomonas phragmiteti]
MGDSPRLGFRGVLLDWRGTLVVAPTYRWLARTALENLGRDASSGVVETVLDRLRSADSSRVDSSAIDTDVAEHRAAYLAWFAAAGLDDELAAALYAAESDAGRNPFATDVGDLLLALTSAGVRIGVVSDIHVDLRPVFAANSVGDERTWADLIDVWALSYELGVAKPDPAIFRFALDRLGMPAQDVLMVGDRGAWDGAAAAIGITTLVLPPLTDAREARLHRVLDLVLPGRAGA